MTVDEFTLGYSKKILGEVVSEFGRKIQCLS